MLGARAVFEMRAPLGGYSMAERARLAQARLRFLASSGLWEPVTVRSVPEGRVVEIAGRGAFYVLPGDLDPASDETLDARAALDLTGALAESREAQSLPAL